MIIVMIFFLGYLFFFLFFYDFAVRIQHKMKSVLVLGGCGFIGRHLVSMLVDANVPTIRVVDKVSMMMMMTTTSSLVFQVLPQIAHLNEKHAAAFAKVIAVIINWHRMAYTDCDVMCCLAVLTP